MTRKDVAKLLRVSTQTVTNLVRDGFLHPLRTEQRGNYFVHVFDENTVRAFAETYKPKSSRAGKGTKYTTERIDQESKALKMFRDGASWQDVAIACKISIDHALHLYRVAKLSPEQMAQEQKRALAEEEDRKWQRELVLQSRRDEARKHARLMAELRAKSPAPIIIHEKKNGGGSSPNGSSEP